MLDSTKDVVMVLVAMLASITAWLYKQVHGDVENIKKDYAKKTETDGDVRTIYIDIEEGRRRMYDQLERDKTELRNEIKHQHIETNKLIKTLIEKSS